jgi:hypothetical protein
MRIDELLGCQHLTDWERRFLHSVSRHETLTQNQQKTLRNIEGAVKRRSAPKDPFEDDWL